MDAGYRLAQGYDVYQHAEFQQCILHYGCLFTNTPYVHWHLFYYGSYSVYKWAWQ